MNFLLVSYLTMQYFQVGCVLEQPPHLIMNVSIQAELGNSEYYTGLTAPAKTQLYVIASNAYTRVVTSIRPVEPSATGIKIFDRQKYLS